ncbi:sorbose reductase [Microdochium nivale]|nr:sorbose reductase [Microdochium nivale]
MSADTLEDVRPMFELTGRNFIVTGGAQGIGFAAARAICEMGGSVAVLDIQAKPLADFDQLAGKYGVKAVYIQTDVTSEASLNSSFEQAVEKLGGSIHGLLPAAGIAIDKPFVEQTWGEYNRIHDINVRGTFFITQLATKQMLKQGTGGSILLVASQSAHIGLPGYRMAAYNASKGAVHMLAKALAVELGPKGIRVNTISPGFVDSQMTRDVRDSKTKREGEQMWLAPPMKRLSTQNDLTGAVIYLLSDASRFTTGTDIAITGGLHCGTIDGVISWADE